jgi:nuclear pore complex protein Nup93
VCSNYLLAQAHVDAPALGAHIAHLNAANTFAPRHALQDTDVDGFLRLVREQNVIATIDEARRTTQADFYRLLEERTIQDWEDKKRRVFEQLGARLGGEGAAKAVGALGRSQAGRSALHVGVSSPDGHIGILNALQASTSTPALTPQTQAKMMAYETAIADLNHARLRGTSFPIIHALIQAALSVPSDVCTLSPHFC